MCRSTGTVHVKVVAAAVGGGGGDGGGAGGMVHAPDAAMILQPTPKQEPELSDQIKQLLCEQSSCFGLQTYSSGCTTLLH